MSPHYPLRVYLVFGFIKTLKEFILQNQHVVIKYYGYFSFSEVRAFCRQM